MYVYNLHVFRQQNEHQQHLSAMLSYFLIISIYIYEKRRTKARQYLSLALNRHSQAPYQSSSLPLGEGTGNGE